MNSRLVFEADQVPGSESLGVTKFVDATYRGDKRVADVFV